jgi:hypothetical protein
MRSAAASATAKGLRRDIFEVSNTGAKRSTAAASIPPQTVNCYCFDSVSDGFGQPTKR